MDQLLGFALNTLGHFIQDIGVTTRKCANCPAQDSDDLQRLRHSICMRWFKAFEAGDNIAMRDRMHQANPFHPEVTTRDSSAGILRQLSPHNLRSSAKFCPVAFDEPDNFATFVSSPHVEALLSLELTNKQLTNKQTSTGFAQTHAGEMRHTRGQDLVDRTARQSEKGESGGSQG